MRKYLIQKGAPSGNGWEQGKRGFEEETWKDRDLQAVTFEDCVHVAGVLGE